MTDVQARLDAAINAHLAGVLLPRGAIFTSNVTRGWIDRYAALVALRARWDEHVMCCPEDCGCAHWTDLTADAERLLEDA